MHVKRSRLVPVLLLGFLAAGCATAYYATALKFGYEKRDILVSRVKEARDDQDAAKKQFKTALERFEDVTNFKGGDLEEKYKELNAEYEKSEDRANDVSNRIAKVQTVAADLFSEWKDELKQYDSADLRRASEQKLHETQARYDQLIAVMKKAEGSMKPVLAKFKDQVLFLKHNLNAQAIASLQTTAVGVQTDVTALIKDMDSSIAEADTFINQMK